MAGLTLSRKVGESILIRALDGSEVTVRVNEVRGNRVRLDVVACLDYEIRRVPSLRVTEDADVVGDRLDGERVLSAAGLGGGLGLETGIEIPEAVAKGENE